MLSHRCGVNIPRLKVEMLKGHCGKFGKPFIILREFYHHLRTFGGKHKGTEKNADKFAREFIETYENFQASP
ncbi:MAG: hypothetical protein QXW17_01825 [Candidatus Bathyarchaeia archaeon]